MTTRLPSHVHLGRATCGQLAEAERREWWLTNGLGAYAAGTVAGSLTRCYHGLLVAPLTPPLGRHLVVAKADATLVDGERETPLFTNRWGGGHVDPDGHRHIESFHLDGRMPTWRFAVGDRQVEMRIWMEPGAHTTYCAFRLHAPGGADGVRLRVRLLVDHRSHHATTSRHDFNPTIIPAPPAAGGAAGLSVHGTAPGHGGTPFDLTLLAVGGTVHPERMWIDAFHLSEEEARGLEGSDNHLAVATASFDLAPQRWVGVVASLEERPDPSLEAAMGRFHDRDREILGIARDASPELHGAPPWIGQLVLAADSFVFARPLPGLPDGRSIIAGYPWFGDWGRDTMIALPGLTLTTGRHDDARSILETFAWFVDRGMLPNYFPNAGEHPEYNTVDAALWYVDAWRAYFERVPDRETMRRIFPVLEEIVDWHSRGTRHGVAMDAGDGLLRSGEPGVQLTWMDAKVGDWVVTPRTGKAVEINALWFNALTLLAEWADELGLADRLYREMAARARQGFQRFVRPTGGLFDVLDGPGGDDATVRPNQIFAVSLPHSALSAEVQARVVAECGRELLTSYGLRSLAPGHPDYRPHYRGGVRERDGAYHQGTVWAWLLGHYALAEYRVHGDRAAALRRLAPIADHLLDAGLGTVSEIFDAAAPHDPRGAPAQAWSVACILDAWVRLGNGGIRTAADNEQRVITAVGVAAARE
jgi:4-alpha-glucanotransferase